jgi:hypothetical protein
VTSQQPGAQLPPTGKRHPFLFQQRFSEQLFWPCILILALSAALLIWNPPKVEPYRVTLSVALAGAGLILVLSMVYRLRAFARCLGSGLCLQLPFYRLLVPYHGIRSTRPTELYRLFPFERQKWPQRAFLRTIIGKTVVVIELEQLPRSRIWLRLWMNKYMISPDRVGLVLAVRDWMSFRAELDEFRARNRHH